MWHAPFHPLRTRVQCGFRATINNACGPAFTCSAESPKRWRRALVDPSPRGPKPKPGILIRQLFAFIRDPAKMPCFIGSPELLGPQERIYIVVLRLRCVYEGHLQPRPGVPGSAGWKTPRS